VGQSYETEESFHGRQGTIPADRLPFPFRLWPMEWRAFLAVRWRGQIGFQEFLQFGTRIPARSGAGTGQGDGSICSNCSDLRVAGALHGCHGGEIAEQRSSVELVVCTCTCGAFIAVSAREIRRDIPAFVPARTRGA
jgi:hypothetical protein